MMNRIRFASEPPYSSLVRALGEELVHEIAVGAVQLEHLEARRMGPAGRLPPSLHQVLDLTAFQRPRHRPFLAVGDRGRRNRAPLVPVINFRCSLQRPVAFPGPAGARLAPGVSELDTGGRALLPDELHQAAQRRDEGIVPDAEIADGAAAAPLDLGRFDHDKPRPSGGELAGIHRCQSVGNPFTAQYWCIGGTTMRLRRLMPRMVIGENSSRPDIGTFPSKVPQRF
jgi:hypothetical protein